MSAETGSEADAIALRLGAVAAEAGAVLAGIGERARGHRVKDDGSPTTAADLASERLILRRLAEGWPDIPVVAEEAGAAAHPGGCFFLVDPLDGTRDFLAGSDEYSVNIALVRDGRPVAAALAAPSVARIWVAGTATLSGAMGQPASEWRPVRARRQGPGGIVALVSRRHGDPETEECLARLAVAERRTVSSALKFGLIASGEADLYLRCGSTMEWDTAAGDHIVACAGGLVVGAEGRSPTYGHVGRRYVNGAFAAFGDPALAPAIRLPRA